MVPLLVKFAVLHKSEGISPIAAYDTLSESLTYDLEDDDLAIWLTGSTITRAAGDPTNDEATDR